jgi:hypothetical protein
MVVEAADQLSVVMYAFGIPQSSPCRTQDQLNLLA